MSPHSKNNAPLKYLALGDSYTIGESVVESERWPNQLADSLNKRGIAIAKPAIIATTGWRTDDLQHAIDHAHLKNEYDYVTLLIGVNNQYQGKSVKDYEPEFKALLETAVKLAGGKKTGVHVVSIPDYGFTPFGEKNKAHISAAIDEFNAVNKRVTLAAGITYTDITGISRTALQHPDLVAPDGLHPSGKMYSLWVSEILKSGKHY